MTDETGESSSDNKRAISSGNPELDGKMGGGIPLGSLTLIEGTSGAGKSVLSQQLIWGSLQQGFTVSLFTSENSVKSLVSQMQSIDLDILDFLLLGRFRVFPMQLARLGGQAPATLVRAMMTERHQDILIVDSFTSAIAHSSMDLQVLSFFEQCKRLCASGVTILVTLHDHAVQGDLIDALRSMCDAHLVLRSEQDGQKLVKALQVAKIRGAASVTGAIVGFDVEPGWGMRVIPISKARG
ncbi:MAG TPA: ATPase domain-containing protein [Aggregatilineaceae bacterium]|nr:ATPase domain-containing protein [Aggregatilineaceae bacterium]